MTAAEVKAMNGVRVMLKVDGTNRKCALDFGQSSLSAVRREKRDQIITRAVGRAAGTLGVGVPQQAQSTTRCDANHHEGSAHTRQDF